MKQRKLKSSQEIEKIMEKFLQYAVKRINQDQGSYDIESEKKNLERDYGVTKHEYEDYVKQAKKNDISMSSRVI